MLFLCGEYQIKKKKLKIHFQGKKFTNLGFIFMEVKLEVLIFFIESIFPFKRLTLASSPFSSPIYTINSSFKLQHNLVIGFLLKIIFSGSFYKKFNSHKYIKIKF